MFPFPSNYNIPSGRALQHLFEARHGAAVQEEHSDADRSIDRKALLIHLKSCKLVRDGQLDLGRGEDFQYVLSGHDAFQNFQRSNWEFPHAHRDPYDTDTFGLLADDKKRELRAQARASKAKYRKNLLEEYKTVFDIQGLPHGWMQSIGNAFSEIRDSSHNQCGKPLERDPKPTPEGGIWNQLKNLQLLACLKLKLVLDELFEIVCCGPKVAEAFDEDDSRGSVCKHASRALTPFLPLCSNVQLRELLLLLGAWDEGEYVRNYAKDMFGAWDIPSECPWLWDVILETTANIRDKRTEDYVDGLTPILSQSEPWGGPMHQEHALACAALLCRDDFGIEMIRAEEGEEGYRGRIGSRCSRNAAFVSELKRVGLEDADNLVMKAANMDAYAFQMDGNYLTSIKKTWAREEARRRCIAENADQVQRWLDETGGHRQVTPQARSKEALAAARRRAFEEAVNRLLTKETPTVADVRRELAAYESACNALEASSSGGSDQAASSGVEAPEAAPRDVRTPKVCDHCGERASDGKKLLRCSDCRKARYCGKECQAAAWRSGGHREACKRQASSAT
ncbi:hypothetical protein KFL_000520290 [Klebsormidium nitens]|uniref:MYND-type domain-containing protein n=1 Tax=Klebsormidium nitens TaxID=105231 RepID=A0A1Y1HUZ5_KLENI|nr:hypothetical protein KFL_000520290 [Klebsormidium nitens]|eukprot:GAQ80357.1 hypothetical protein KFL_000520290 [Klebsormidium nitens]